MIIMSYVRRVSGKARPGSSESLWKNPALEFGESREKPAREFGESLEKPGSGVRRVSGKARPGSSESLWKTPFWSSESLGKSPPGSSESLWKNPAQEFGESREKPGSGVRIVSGKGRQCR